MDWDNAPPEHMWSGVFNRYTELLPPAQFVYLNLELYLYPEKWQKMGYTAYFTSSHVMSWAL
jgi:hypothetical protein